MEKTIWNEKEFLQFREAVLKAEERLTGQTTRSIEEVRDMLYNPQILSGQMKEDYL